MSSHHRAVPPSLLPLQGSTLDLERARALPAPQDSCMHHLTADDLLWWLCSRDSLTVPLFSLFPALISFGHDQASSTERPEMLSTLLKQNILTKRSDTSDSDSPSPPDLPTTCTRLESQPGSCPPTPGSSSEVRSILVFVLFLIPAGC